MKGLDAHQDIVPTSKSMNEEIIKYTKVFCFQVETFLKEWITNYGTYFYRQTTLHLLYISKHKISSLCKYQKIRYCHTLI